MDRRTESHDPTQIESQPITNIDEMPIGTEKDLFIGSGKVVGLVGKGGMAAVYKIWNNGLEKHHAVKIAFPAEPKMYERFKTEAKIASKLKHTNIIEIKNVSEWNGLPFIEMEFIDGKTLRDLLKERKLFPPSVAAAVAVFITRALAWAHSATIPIEGKPFKEIIHRDLKPENIMISRAGQVTLMDFGLAQPKGISLHTTQIQGFIGTPLYAAPEQFENFIEKPDHRADIFAVGEIVYEMLTGCNLIQDDAVVAQCTDIEQAMPRIYEIKKRRSYKHLGDFKLNLPSRLIKIVERCLEPERKKRYQTSRELLEELESCYKGLAKASVEACTQEYFSETETEEKAKPQKKGASRANPLPMVVAFMIVVCGVFAALVMKTGPRSHTQSLPAKKTAPVVPLPPDPANTIPRTDAQFTPLAQVDSNADFIDKKSRVVPSPAVSMKRSEGQTPAHSPASDKKEDFTRNIETDKKPVLSASPPGAAPTQAPTAIQRKTEKKATDIGRNPGENSLGSIQLPSLPDTANRLQKLYSSVDPIEIAQFALEKKAFDDALAALASLPENHPKSGIKTVLMLDIYRKTGKFQDAKQLIDRSAVDVAEFDLAVGKIYMDMGNYQKAVQYFNQTQEKKCLSPDRRQVVIEEALYCCARASQKLYEEDKSQLTLEAARDAWNNLKKNLSARTGDPRYKEAVDILSKL